MRTAAAQDDGWRTIEFFILRQAAERVCEGGVPAAGRQFRRPDRNDGRARRHHALIQATPGRDASNQLVADAARRHRGRLFPIYRPEALLGDLGTGTMERPTQETLRQNAHQVAENIEGVFPGLGMVGMGEFIVGGFVTTALDPIEIARDVAPIMEALRPKRLPIQFPTAMSGWKGGPVLYLRAALDR